MHCVRACAVAYMRHIPRKEGSLGRDEFMGMKRMAIMEKQDILRRKKGVSSVSLRVSFKKLFDFRKLSGTSSNESPVNELVVSSIFKFVLDDDGKSRIQQFWVSESKSRTTHYSLQPRSHTNRSISGWNNDQLVHRIPLKQWEW